MLLLGIPIYSYLCLILGIICISSGSFVASINPRANLNRTYFGFCLGIFIWLISMALLSSKQFDLSASVFLGKMVYVGVAFMPTLALHFCVEYLDKTIAINKRLLLFTNYILTFLFLCLLCFSKDFVTGIYDYSWGYFPKVGFIHLFHISFVLGTAFYAIRLLLKGLKFIETREGKSRKYYECKSVLLALMFVTMGGTDFLHNWGYDFFPIGGIFVTLFVVFITYAIFKYQLLGVSIVIEKGLIYSVLVSFIASLYFTAVYLMGMFVGDLTKAHSFPIILAILAIITLIFKPIERKIQETIDALFFKKSRKVMEQENLLLMKEMQNHDRLKSVATLAAGMAHEIKNPLTSIRTFAEFLPKKYDDAEFRERFSHLVVDEVDRVNSIIQQLLDFSKPRELEVQPVELGNLIGETLDLLSSNLVKSRIGVERAIQGELWISGDRGQLKQVFVNLFLNAIQAMPGGGTLKIAATKTADGGASVIVEDTGPGIPKEHLSHIFDPFFTTKESGSGLGLAVVHGIISRHGGRIKAGNAAARGAAISVFLKS